MSEVLSEAVNEVLSTYQWVTVGQLLEGYGLKLPDAYVIELLGQKTAFYYRLLRIPAINVLNGIIIEQIRTYQIFIQKLFVEYLVSGESDTDEAGGSDTRIALEAARTDMLKLSTRVEALELMREDLILESQRSLKRWVDDFVTVLKQIRMDAGDDIKARSQNDVQVPMRALYHLFVDANGFEIKPAAWTRFWQALSVTATSDLENAVRARFEAIKPFEASLNTYFETYDNQVTTLREQLVQLRKAFYDDISRVQNLLIQLPGFKLDETQDAENRRRLVFDTKIGE